MVCQKLKIKEISFSLVHWQNWQLWQSMNWFRKIARHYPKLVQGWLLQQSAIWRLLEEIFVRCIAVGIFGHQMIDFTVIEKEEIPVPPIWETTVIIRFIAASSQDTAPALIALGATIITSNREVLAEEFFVANGFRSCVLEDGEIVTHIQVPKTKKSVFEKFALRKSIDFPIVNCAAAYGKDGSVRVALGGVYPAPLRISAAEKAVAKGISEATAQKAGDDAVADCTPLSGTAYKIEIARTMVKRTLLRLAE